MMAFAERDEPEQVLVRMIPGVRPASWSGVPRTESPPPAPAGLTALPGSKQVALGWSATKGSTGYKVKRALVSGGAYTTIATLSSNVLAYADTNVTGGSTYYYVVSATNSAGEGPISSEVSAVVRATLMTYLKFDETNGITALDSTGNGWNGTLFNATNWVAGLSNNAVNLSSNTSAYVKLPNGVVGNLTDFSISAWMRVKMPVLAPIPSASVRMAVRVNPLAEANCREAKRISFHISLYTG